MKYYGEDKQLDRDVEAFIRREVYRCQTSLVDDMLVKDENCEMLDCIENYCDDEGESQEVLEWWLVSSWSADKLAEMGEVVLRWQNCEWWGRTCSGQAIALDSTWYKIWQSIRG